MSRCLIIAVMLHVTAAAAGQEANQPLDRKAVAQAIAAGKKFLIDKKVDVAAANPPQAHWEVDIPSRSRPGGWTALTLLALLQAGEKPDSDVIQRGLRYLRSIPPESTYVVGLQTAVFTRIGQPEDKARIQRNVDWLIETRILDMGKLTGWGYKRGNRSADNSNTQYAVLGLDAARRAGAKIEPDVWASIQTHYLESQTADGGWLYVSALRTPTLTMTAAGLSSMLIVNEAMAVTKIDDNTGLVQNCGVRRDSAAASKAGDWIAKNFSFGRPEVAAVYYNLNGLARAGRYSGLRYFGRHDWRREGGDFLLNSQQTDGSWHIKGSYFDSWPVVSTSFALLFLAQAETPILFTKLVHGEEGKLDGDWNRQRHDLRNLADYAAREIYRQPELAWQVFNHRQTGKKAEELLPDLLPSPLAFMSGHESPITSSIEESLLQLYLKEGGTLLAEACCGSKEFDKGFRAWMNRLYPDKLVRLKSDHPVWQAHAQVTADDFELWGIDVGGRTIVYYSPRPLSGWWEANRLEDGRGRQAFRLAGNIIRLAAGPAFPKAPPP